MRRSLIIAEAILATMTVALVALAVEPFVDGDTITDLPSDHATDRASDRVTDRVTDRMTDRVTDKATDRASDRVTDHAIDQVTDAARVLVNEILDDGRDTLTFANLMRCSTTQPTIPSYSNPTCPRQATRRAMVLPMARATRTRVVISRRTNDRDPMGMGDRLPRRLITRELLLGVGGAARMYADSSPRLPSGHLGRGSHSWQGSAFLDSARTCRRGS